MRSLDVYVHVHGPVLQKNSFFRPFNSYKALVSSCVTDSPKLLQGSMHFGHAVGPEWAKALPQSSIASHITLEYGVDVTSIQSHTSDDNSTQHPTQHHTQHPTQPHAEASQRQSTSQPSSDAKQQTINSTGDQDAAWPVTVCLSNGKSYGADLVISAIGVQPNTGWLPEEVCRDESDGGIIVDRYACPSLLTNKRDRSFAVDSCVCICSFYK